MKLFNPETGLSDNYERAKFLFAWRVTVICTIVFTVLLGVYIAELSEEFVVMIIALLISISALIHLRRTKKYKLVYWAYLICGLAIPHFMLNFETDAVYAKEFLWIVATVLLAFIGLGKKVGIAVLLINGIGLGVFLGLSLNSQLVDLSPRTNPMLIGDFLEICATLFCIGYLLIDYLKMNEQLTKEVREVNTNLRKQNNENTLLLKEVHHRVKNNLQIISSLLRLQKSELSDNNEIKKFDDAINRVMTMSLIHQKLYQDDNLSQIKLQDYIFDLANEIKGVFNEGKKIEITVKSEFEKINIKTLVPLGLILNELLSNSFKHAFKGEEGKVKIDITKGAQNKFFMEYNDFGSWVKEESKDGFGLILVQTLSEQLDGGFVRNGSLIKFEFENIA